MDSDSDLPLGTVHPELFHYTTLAGVEGILTTQTLWATQYLYLNDKTEIVGFKDHLKSTLLPTARDIFTAMVFDGEIPSAAFKQVHGSFDQAVTDVTNKFVDATFAGLNDQIYIISFCGTPRDGYVRKNGQLSQWRGYSGGGGYCIQFDSRRLMHLLALESARFEIVGVGGDVVYSDEEGRLYREFRRELNHSRDYFRAMIASLKVPNDSAPPAEEFLRAFLHCITRYKHRAFKEEQEVRIALTRVDVDEEAKKLAAAKKKTLKAEMPVHRGQARAQEVQFVKLFDGLKGARLPIDRIIVGPQPDQEAAAKRVAKLCSECGIDPELSDMPFRSQ